ncbi:MAG: universal stress protein [Candidatus Accumulibacter sp.]|uniref:Universal stress protein n=1 Tax=Candidatus Accumulibacter proximus TaxID=2954385 RepID=A0A935UHI5_9PROT|nr:universal stress protein [Candidatus Accumulibacter proximus]
MSGEPRIPTAAGCQRDSDGRLVGLIFDSTPPLPAPGTNPWLVAVDGSDNALRAVGYAVRQAGEMHACSLHLVNVQHWLSKEAAETELARKAWPATARARAVLDADSQPWRLHVAMGDAAERIMELAVGLHCNRIVVGSRRLGVAESLLFGSVTNKLMLLSGPPLEVVP